jgi:hypothetical protein
LYYAEHEDSDSDVTPVSEPDPEPVKKKMKTFRKGPPKRSHMSSEFPISFSFVPSSDSDSDYDLPSKDDDGAKLLHWALPSGRKSRAKKLKKRAWYDESRIYLEE